MGTIKVVLAEDHALMRDAVKLVFDEEDDVVLVGEVANGNDLLPLLKQVEADFVLLDVQMPGARRPRLPRGARPAPSADEGGDALGCRGSLT